MATAVKWLMDRPGVEDRNIEMAKKYMDTTTDQESQKEDLEYLQAKCKVKKLECLF